MTRWLARGLVTACLSLAPLAHAQALTLISEVFYDAVGTDDGLSFIELWGTPGTDLSGYVLEGINGTGGGIAPSLALSGTIPGDGFFVIADGLSDGTTLVVDANQILNFDLQNGPDSVQLLGPDTSVLDAVGYGVFAPGEIFAGEGTPTVDPAAGSSIARLFANLDTDQNAVDFAAAAPNPGTGALASVPEPSTAGMLALGLVALVRSGRRRSPRA